MANIGILNVGCGDIKISFDPKNTAECIRAARIVKDMMKRGYVLLVEVSKGKYQRVLEFDDKKYEYIIADFEEKQDETSQMEKKKPGRKSISAKETNGIAVARTAGG